MLSEQRLAQIRKMEMRLNEGEELIEKLTALQAQWEAFSPLLDELFEYYFNGAWRLDYEAYDNNEIPRDMPCGVLSQDAVYDLFSQKIEMLKRWQKIANQQKMPYK